ncbi:MAG: DNA polymerase Y family protein [Burkholderiaceae bacterium]|nr:MAG: DNA polymerase Y family protein [Burkholderiaceae bacterium]
MTPLWLALSAPSLPIEVFLRGIQPVPADHAKAADPARAGDRTVPDDPAGPPDGTPVAVCAHQHVLLANAAAQALGVRPGIRRATALALAPTVRLLERNPAREDLALQQLACWAGQFTPSVSLQPSRAPEGRSTPHLPHDPAGLLLEIAPSLTLFGGLDALLSRVDTGAAALGFSVRTACAPTPSGAWLLSLQHTGLRAMTLEQLAPLLQSLPIGLLPSARAHTATLDSIGARTLGDLLRLPRAGLARRFGKALLLELDQAFGQQPEPRRWFEPPERFDSRLELLAQVEVAEALLFAAQRLVLELAGWLSARHAAVRRIDLLGEHDEQPPTCVTLRLSDATRDPARIIGLLRERLASLRLPAPVHTVRLHCDEVVSLSAQTEALFPSPAQTRESLNRLIERLQARLGPEHVQRLLLVADHRPEVASRTQPVDQRGLPPGPGSGSGSGSGPVIAGALPRPLWLLPSPIALQERNNRPYWHGPLTLLAGPERIESGWWDSRLIQRDYFIASDDSDMLLWIYRERLPAADSRQGWFVQGKFG